MKLINELNEREFQLGVADEVSWHSEYKDSAWIFLGEVHVFLPYCSFPPALLRNISAFPLFVLTFITHFRFFLLSAHKSVFHLFSPSCLVCSACQISVLVVTGCHSLYQEFYHFVSQTVIIFIAFYFAVTVDIQYYISFRFTT